MKYKRIIILGGSGSGKSTLANRISVYTGYPIYHLDKLTFNADRKRKSISECEEISKQFLLNDNGIVDGNYLISLPERIKWTDFIIYIDIPAYLQLYRFIGRNIKYFFGIENGYGRPENTKQDFIKELLLCIGWNINHRKKIFSLLESIKDKKVVITNRPRKLDIEKLLIG